MLGVCSGGRLSRAKKRLARHLDAIFVGYKPCPLATLFLRMQMPTSYEIYQTYLRGPAAVIRLFEQALGTQAIYGTPAPGHAAAHHRGPLGGDR